MQVEDPETAVARIIELVKTRIPKRFGLDPIRDIQVLCPMNRGGAGARSLNIELQAALNPAGDRKVERFGWTFAPGDKVMQIENDYEKEVYNGDIGTIDDVDSNSGELIASFDGRSVTYGFGELDMLVPAYAATIHKSQGSEYPAVIIPGQGVRADWSGASHSRSRRARRERHATEHPASRASAQAATRRSLPGHRTQPDQIGPCRLELQMQPQRRPRSKFDHS